MDKLNNNYWEVCKIVVDCIQFINNRLKREDNIAPLQIDLCFVGTVAKHDNKDDSENDDLGSDDDENKDNNES